MPDFTDLISQAKKMQERKNDIYKKFKNIFSDAELIDVKKKD